MHSTAQSSGLRGLLAHLDANGKMKPALLAGRKAPMPLSVRVSPLAQRPSKANHRSGRVCLVPRFTERVEGTQQAEKSKPSVSAVSKTPACDLWRFHSPWQEMIEDSFHPTIMGYDGQLRRDDVEVLVRSASHLSSRWISSFASSTNSDARVPVACRTNTQLLGTLTG